MPIRPCPNCTHDTPRWLDVTSQTALVNYYRCDQCGTVWTLPKEAPADHPPQVIGQGQKPEVSR